MITIIKRFGYTLAVVPLLSLIVPLSALAASFQFVPSLSTVSAGDQVVVILQINSPDKSVNAVSGTISFSSDILSLTQISDANSIVTFWVQKPTVGDSQNGTSSFSGVMIGGFGGVASPYYSGVRPGKILGFRFTATHSGTAAVELKNIQLYANDGLGTAVAAIATPLVLAINPMTAPVKTVLAASSTLPTITAKIIQDKSVDGGKKTLVVAAEDKGAGIDHYEVQETSNPVPGLTEWVSVAGAATPYVLRDQSGKSYIFVKVVDNNGNQTIATITPATSTLPLAAFNDEYLLLLAATLLVIGGVTTRAIFLKKEIEE